MRPLLIVILGPTAVGKTELTLSLAEYFHCPILNCDSRQIYKDMEIGTASPTEQQRKRVEHYFVGQLELDAYYSAAMYEQEVLSLTDKLFQKHDTLILSGGSMMYIDAVCNGIDDIPTANDEVRTNLYARLKDEGLDVLLEELRLVDPQHYNVVDRKNWKRVVHALEIYYTTGKPYSAFLTRKSLRSLDGDVNENLRPFDILKIGLERPREELFERMPYDNFKLILDVYWLASVGINPAKFIAKYKDKIACLHYKDLKVVKHDKQTYAEVGQGNLDWDEIIAASKECSAEFALVEQDKCDGDPFESLKTSYDFLKEKGFN